jgi:xanthine dehydrogenase accessory factor
MKEPFPAQPAFGLIVTRGHNRDALVLQHWAQYPFVFLGMIGSQRKRRLIFSQLLEQGLATPAQLDRVACPVGLDIHAVTVPEIALSVMSLLVKERAEKVNAALKIGAEH